MERYTLTLAGDPEAHLAEADTLNGAVALADRLADYHGAPVRVSPPRHLWLVGERVCYPHA